MDPERRVPGGSVRWMADRGRGALPPETDDTVGGEDWQGRELDGVRIVRTAFVDVDLTEAASRGAVFDECTFSGCAFNCSTHVDSAFTNCTFNRCTFFEASLHPLQDGRQPVRAEHVQAAPGRRRGLVLRGAGWGRPARGDDHRGADAGGGPDRRPVRGGHADPGRPLRGVGPAGGLHRVRPAGERPVGLRPADDHARPGRSSRGSRRRVLAAGLGLDVRPE